MFTFRARAGCGYDTSGRTLDGVRQIFLLLEVSKAASSILLYNCNVVSIMKSCSEAC